MATLTSLADGRLHHPTARCVVGRSRSCHLRLDDRTISAEHAVIAWSGERWELRDLGSRNGTRVDEQAVGSGEVVVLAEGARVHFGTGPQVWRVADTRPPGPLAEPVRGGDPVQGTGGLLVLPPSGAPALMVYQDGDGDWQIEQDGVTRPAEDGGTLELPDGRWVLRLPEILPSTWDHTPQLALGHLGLRFGVSLDEEHVALTAHAREQTLDLGSRAYHYMLLTLARARLLDAEDADLPRESHGWLYADELARRLGIDVPTLNVHIFRARRQLAREGVQGAAGLVERRSDTRQVRLGVGRIEVIRGG